MTRSRRDFLRMGACVAAGVAGGAARRVGEAAAKQTDEGKPVKNEEAETFYKLFPVGTVKKEGGSTRLVIRDKYVPALKGLDGFSHVVVLYWFHKNDTPKKRAILQVHPRGNRRNPRTGVFACRAPVRPNLIATTTCKILSVEGGVVTVDKIDAFDDTPILDLKPYLIGPTKGVRYPDWLGGKKK